MTATEPAPSELPVGPHTIAAWRRRRQACEEPLSSPSPDQTPANGPKASDTAASGVPNTIGLGFDESQRAGLSAILSLAKATDVPHASLPAAEPRPPGSDPSAASLGMAGAIPPQPAPPSTVPDEAVDLHPITVRPLPALGRPTSNRPSSRVWLAAVWNGLRARQITALPLVIILTVQACLSVRLPWSNTAYTDEALYLWAGRLDWANMVHGAASPAFPTYFSGAPVLYPPLGAIIYSIGGLAGARLLSLCFMLAASCLLWATTSSLYGRLAASFAAGIWVVLGPTQFLGAFATYDPMALFLIALATWCSVRAASSEHWVRWVAISALALTLANATKYATVIFDPVVISIAYFAYGPERNTKLARARAVAILTYTTALLIALVKIGGVWYTIGIEQTTLNRSVGNDQATKVLAESAHWVGLVAIVAALGALICIVHRRGRPIDPLPLFLASAIALVPVEQARIHTVVSLDKHVDFGAWFAAIAAGYAAARMLRVLRAPRARIIACSAGAGLLLVPATIGAAQAHALFSWPNSSRFVATLRPLIKDTPGHLLTDDTAILKFYLNVPWQRWSTTSSITLPSGHTISSPVGTEGDPALYVRYLKQGYFSLVILPLGAKDLLDNRIAAMLKHDPDYSLVTIAPYGNSTYEVWRYKLQRRQPDQIERGVAG
jgi:hypothetical protein